MKKTVTLLLDSGAFSAWNNKTEVKLNDYVAFIKEHKEMVWEYINLDTIPPDWSAAETEKAAKDSYRKLQLMKDKGLNPIPVLRQGDRLHWLEQMLKDGERYICLSTKKDLFAKGQRTWLDEMFSILCNKDGQPLVKVHGLGIGLATWLTRYPFFSVDFTTWSLTAGYGKFLMPTFHNGAYDYMRQRNVIITDYPQGNKLAQRMLFDYQGPVQQAEISRYIHDVMGTTLHGMRYDPNQRRRANIRYYLELEKLLVHRRFEHVRSSFSEFKIPKMKPVDIPTHIIFATSIRLRQFSHLLTNEGANKRLLSFYELSDLPDKVLETYIKTGTDGTVKKERPLKKAAWKSSNYTSMRRLAMHKRMEEVNGTS